MAEKVDFLIIGGGIMGCSVAYNLAKRGHQNILVIERNLLGTGSTSKAAGGVRQQFSSVCNIEIGKYGVDFFTNIHERLGLEQDELAALFWQVGYLFLLFSPEQVQIFQKNMALQQSLNVPVVWLEPEQLAKKYAWLNLDGVLGATFCPTDGYGSPNDVTQGFAKVARRLGVRFWEETEVKGIYREGRKLTGVETSRGKVLADTIIGCAGAWSGELGKMLDVDIPVYPVKRQAFFTEAFDGGLPVNPDMPFVIDMGSGFHFRREGPGFLLGESDPNQAPGFDTTLDWNWLDVVVEHAIERVPAFENAQILSGWAGLYDTSPDHNGIVGKLPELDNFYLATGFSGHGFMQSPAVGLLLSELILDGKAHTIDITEMGIERLREGKFNREHNII
jgi:sarcosine oxidase subunit beta